VESCSTCARIARGDVVDSTTDAVAMRGNDQVFIAPRRHVTDVSTVSANELTAMQELASRFGGSEHVSLAVRGHDAVFVIRDAGESYAAVGSGEGASAFGEKLLNLLDEASVSTTYKFAVLLALTDVCLEHSRSDGRAPDAVPTEDVARRVLEIYWPQTSPFFGTGGHAKVLSQSNKG
jgi:hypothetical protein